MKAGMGLLLWGGLCVGIAARQASALAQEPERQEAPRICDPTAIQELEEAARALVVAEGCTEVSQCRTAPVGVRACGGPRDYIVYCAETTDEQRLLRALDQLARREERFNRQCDIFSICIFTPPPEVELVEGVCQAVTPPTEILP
jgi:hypothetical protein